MHGHNVLSESIDTHYVLLWRLQKRNSIVMGNGLSHLFATCFKFTKLFREIELEARSAELYFTLSHWIRFNVKYATIAKSNIDQNYMHLHSTRVISHNFLRNTVGKI